MFTTFLVTIDLSSFDIAVQGGTEYVMRIIQNNSGNFITGGGLFRIIGSRVAGFEDVFQWSETNSSERPGYLRSQLDFEFEQYAGAFTIAPHLTGDYDFDGDVDPDDHTKWRETFGSTTDLMADGNDDGVVDLADYVVWRNHLGATLAAASTSPANIPEPGTLLFLLIAGALAIARRRP